MELRNTLLALASGAMLGPTIPRTAQAHFNLVEPPPADNSSDGGKGGPPCGPTSASKVVTQARGGQAITVSLKETVMHPGHYRIALSVNSRSELPSDPAVSVNGRSVSAAVASPAVFPVLADGVFPHTTGSAPITWQTSVVLPNVTCAKCTLQVIEFMANPGGDYFYHHCADLQITADPDLPMTVLDAGAPDAASSPGDGSARGGSGAGGASGTGGRTGGSRDAGTSSAAVTGGSGGGGRAGGGGMASGPAGGGGVGGSAGARGTGQGGEAAGGSAGSGGATQTGGGVPGSGGVAGGGGTVASGGAGSGDAGGTKGGAGGSALAAGAGGASSANGGSSAAAGGSGSAGPSSGGCSVADPPHGAQGLTMLVGALLLARRWRRRP